jgi:hypothetical protein
MKQTLLLFLSADRLHAQCAHKGQITAQADFTNNPDGHKKFAAFLETINYPCYLLTDLIEEDFRHEVVPHLVGSNRTALLKRKFEQFYRNTPFYQATLLQRQKTGRRDDEMLFSALTNPTLITPWVDALLAQKIPLIGIYSVPQTSAPLIQGLKAEHLLLISWEKFAGLRQTYFSNRHLQISRLTPIYHDTPFHESVIKEISRTYQYLKSLSLLPAGQTLYVHILCNAKDRNQFFDRLTNSRDMLYDFADIETVSAQLKISQSSPDSDATQIYLHQLAQHPPKVHYAHAHHTRYFALWQLKHTLNFASTAIFSMAVIWSAFSFWQSRFAIDDAKSMRIEAQRVSAEAQSITRTFPNTYAQANDMKAAVTTLRKLDRYGLLVDDATIPLSQVLSRYPQIKVMELKLETSATEPIAPNTAGDIPARILTFKAELTGFANNYRAALNYLEQFQNELAAQGNQITTLSKPFDASPNASVADQNTDGSHPLSFSLKISHRPPL